MKRALFFFIERLEISKSERISVITLLIITLLLSANYHLKQPIFNDDPEYYAELEEMFRQKSAEIELERNMIMARYTPELSLVDSNTAPTSSSLSSQIPVMTEAENISPGSDRTVVLDPDKININTATVEELIRLPGIGPAYARRIVEWREQNGPFTSIEQLLEIRGIGPKRLADLRPFIALDKSDDEESEG